MRRKCKECGQEYGRRTSRAGRKGYCGKLCQRAKEVREALELDEIRSIGLSVLDSIKKSFASPHHPQCRSGTAKITKLARSREHK